MAQLAQRLGLDLADPLACNAELAADPVGYRMFAHDATVCVTTDLGFVPEVVVPHFRDNDLLILEANHDEEMLQAGPYPSFLKRRVLGQHGHLSNAATGRALAACGERVPPDVWLAHLSHVNNTPTLAARHVNSHLTAAGLEHVRVAVTRRNQCGLHWSSEPRMTQLRLF